MVLWFLQFVMLFLSLLLSVIRNGLCIVLYFVNTELLFKIGIIFDNFLIWRQFSFNSSCPGLKKIRYNLKVTDFQKLLLQLWHYIFCHLP